MSIPILVDILVDKHLTKHPEYMIIGESLRERIRNGTPGTVDSIEFMIFRGSVGDGVGNATRQFDSPTGHQRRQQQTETEQAKTE